MYICVTINVRPFLVDIVNVANPLLWGKQEEIQFPTSIIAKCNFISLVRGNERCSSLHEIIYVNPLVLLITCLSIR